MLNFDKIDNDIIKNTLDKYKSEFTQMKFINYFYRSVKETFYELNNYFKKDKKNKPSPIFRKINYDNYWSKFNEDRWRENKYCWHRYNKQFFLGPSHLVQTIFQNLTIDLIKKFKPKSILEVGCGVGMNIFKLAKEFNNIEFVGTDISTSAIRKCNEKNLSFYYLKNVSFHEQNAEHLSDKKGWGGGEFDLIFTSMALEQMNSIKNNVINSIINVAKEKIILFEPFKDVNNNFLNNLHTSNSDFFDMSYEDLNSFTRIKKNIIIDNFPQRLVTGSSYVILDKVN